MRGAGWRVWAGTPTWANGVMLASVGRRDRFNRELWRFDAGAWRRLLDIGIAGHDIRDMEPGFVPSIAACGVRERVDGVVFIAGNGETGFRYIGQPECVPENLSNNGLRFLEVVDATSYVVTGFTNQIYWVDAEPRRPDGTFSE